MAEPRYACGRCGTWTCVSCGWKRSVASRFYQGHFCIQCPSHEGVMQASMHTERMWRRHNDPDTPLPEPYPYGQRPSGEPRTSDTGPEFYRGIRVPATGPYARLDVPSFKRGVDAVLDKKEK